MTKVRTAQRNGGNPPPISSHPVFPAIVALWFAALLGIGTLVLPNVLIERMIDTSGLAAFVPALAPPIGFTGKSILASLAGTCGIFAGLFVARQVVASQSAAHHDRGYRAQDAAGWDAPAKRPILATEEFGEEGLGPVDEEDDRPRLPGRRRALSVTDDSGPSEFLLQVPLPGEGDEAPAAATPPTEASLPRPIEFLAADPANRRDGSNLVPDAESPAEKVGDARPFDTPIAFPAENASGNESESSPAVDSVDEMQAVDTGNHASLDNLAEARAETLASSPTDNAADPAGTLDNLSLADLIARFATAMQGANENEAIAPEPSIDPAVVPEEPLASSATTDEAVPFSLARESDPAPITTFSLSMRQPAPNAPLAAFSGSDRKVESAAETMPVALRPLDLGEFEEDENEEDPFAAHPGFSFGAAERMFAAPTPGAQEQTSAAGPLPFPRAEEDGDTGNDDAYSSLLSMKAPLGNHREFVRIEDDDATCANAASDGVPEERVVFPGQSPLAASPHDAPRPFDAPAAATAGGLARAIPTMPAQKPVDAAETERALREALEKLQRLSGAA